MLIKVYIWAGLDSVFGGLGEITSCTHRKILLSNKYLLSISAVYIKHLINNVEVQHFCLLPPPLKCIKSLVTDLICLLWFFTPKFREKDSLKGSQGVCWHSAYFYPEVCRVCTRRAFVCCHGGPPSPANNTRLFLRDEHIRPDWVPHGPDSHDKSLHLLHGQGKQCLIVPLGHRRQTQRQEVSVHRPPSRQCPPFSHNCV